MLFALGDGIELQLLADSDWDSDAAFQTGIDTARFLARRGPDRAARTA